MRKLHIRNRALSNTLLQRVINKKKYRIHSRKFKHLKAIYVLMRAKMESDFTAFLKVAYYSTAKIILEKFQTKIYTYVQSNYTVVHQTKKTHKLFTMT